MSDENGSTRMPLGGAGLSATPARPRPRSSKQLDDQAPEGVADQHRRLVERADLLLVVVDDLRDAEALELVCLRSQLLDVPFLARPLGSGDGEPALPEVVGEVLPASRREPGAVDQHQRDPVASRCDSLPRGLLLFVDARTLRRARPEKVRSAHRPRPEATQSLGSSVRAGRCVSHPSASRTRRAVSRRSSRRRSAATRREIDRKAQRRIERHSRDTRNRLFRPFADEDARRPRRPRPAASADPRER